MENFNTLRLDLMRGLSLCGAWDGKLYWYKDTIQLLKKMMQFVPPTTNADRIRAMSDEELMTWIMEMQACPYELYQDCQHPNYDCETCIKDWLKQEA